MRWLDGITDAMDMKLGKFGGMVRDREACMLQSMGSQRVRHDWVTEQQQSDMRVNQWSYKIAAMHSVLQINFCVRKYC